ncbi:MAG TPA: 2-hydroxyhepta-2,4-diene-1,7-dioate isomerase [Sulfitobacter sp.]|uniref:fumarylacetoacetate hydrolase family protein n=1 Tax=Sulfitobacter dubius TaxID=218673 RepID=UPI000E8FFC9D|nr:2-hydroxyhepta-2,4-diene-1,7-dioate isomerase [Sulfitobacter sp.]
MRLMRYGTRDGAKTPVVLDAAGQARDVSSLVGDFTPETIPAIRNTLEGVDLEGLPLFETQGKRVAPPVSQPRNIWGIGLNYSDHAAESGMPVPTEPILFNKASRTYCGPNDPLLYAKGMSKLDWEVELGVVIGHEALNVSRADALDYVLGYCVVHDVSERAWQAERGGQWVKGKSFPNFCPTGPVLVTGDELGDPGKLALWAEVNGERLQDGTTEKMIFDVATIIAYMSEFIQLEPGDLICTGTPPGVGMGLKPPRYLSPGDRVRLGVEGLGEQEQVVERLADR